MCLNFLFIWSFRNMYCQALQVIFVMLYKMKCHVCQYHLLILQWKSIYIWNQQKDTIPCSCQREREKKREKSKDKHWANDYRFNANKDCFMTFDTHNFNLFRMIWRLTFNFFTWKYKFYQMYLAPSYFDIFVRKLEYKNISNSFYFIVYSKIELM